MNDEGFIGFLCSHCHTEIEATPDLIGEAAECPACGAKLVIPGSHEDDVVRHGPGEADPASDQALKSRTIRIELGDL